MGLTIPYFVYLAAGDSEEGFWVQLLVIVLLAAGVGVYGVAKSRIKKQAGGVLKEFYSRFIGAARSIVYRRPASPIESIKLVSQSATSSPKIGAAIQQTAKPTTKGRPFFAEATKGKDLKSGMELLAKDFLVEVVEETNAIDQLDIAMRRMCFTELIRREELLTIASDALKVYILDEGGFYGKVIQCAAMKELAGRTSESNRESADPSRLGVEPRQDEAAVNVGREIDG